MTSPVNFSFTGTLAASNSCCANADLADAFASLSVFTGVDEDRDPMFNPLFIFRRQSKVAGAVHEMFAAPDQCAVFARLLVSVALAPPAGAPGGALTTEMSESLA